MENVEYVDVTLNTDYEFDKNIKASFHRADHPDNGCVIKIMAKDKKICIFSDLEDPQYISDDVARYADILIYDGMYDKEDKLNHKGDGHSTWQDGIEYARAHEVNRLIITHHSPDKTDQELTALENKAKAELLGTVFARSGEKYNF